MFIFFSCIFHVEQYACSHTVAPNVQTHLKIHKTRKKETFIFFHCQTDTDVSAVIVKIISHINYILMAY